ncbi:SUMF1/EgtB/PvdO family nonheme iron enzyme [Rothia endophytica]|uniref:Sulfatase-modifying factor enzyme-like domain-containing protein n=1 Tax=Rothia endophytica TaxID=1324766 RepID=A0ABP9BDJ2_9MICC
MPEARRDFETPQRQVTIDQQFAMSQTLVTVNRFQACVDDTGYQVRAGAWNYQP